MSGTRQAAGLAWSFDGDAWNAADARGKFQVVEYQPGVWTALWFPARPACGCGRGALGGSEHDGFAAAAAAAVRLADDDGEVGACAAP